MISKFIGNGSKDGPFINLGDVRTPTAVMVTAITLAFSQYYLIEGDDWVFVECGVKLRSTDAAVNKAGEYYYIEVSDE